ncbi:MAG: polysaccharide deacetylase family protein [Gemmataceae bacterium]|nr:polysaccharide deacetylase family protein [Gemmataceae bacterium]
MAAAPDLPGAIARAGHLVGNHTFTHTRLGWWDRAGAYAELARCQDLLPAGVGWFRPPFGRITPGLWRAARRLGLGVVTWTLDSNDWQCRTEVDAAACAAEVLERVRPGDTILFHDDHPGIGPILDVVLPGLASRGLLGGGGSVLAPVTPGPPLVGAGGIDGRLLDG